jgi:hypothetical protein
MEQVEEFMLQMVGLYNKNPSLMDGTTGPVKRLFEEGDVVWGVWRDDTEPYGIDMIVLKGTRVLRDCAATGKNVEARVTVVPCDCYEQALAPKKVFGERDLDG